LAESWDDEGLECGVAACGAVADEDEGEEEGEESVGGPRRVYSTVTVGG